MSHVQGAHDPFDDPSTTGSGYVLTASAPRQSANVELDWSSNCASSDVPLLVLLLPAAEK
jgi:hypothetical protein